MDPGYKVKAVKGKGLGLFAVQAIPANFTLMRTPILVLGPKDDIPDGHALAHYIWAYPYTRAGDKNEFSQLTAIAFGDVTMMNHSDDANCDWRWLPKQRLHLTKTLRKIERGEELTFDYGWPDEMWAAMGGKK